MSDRKYGHKGYMQDERKEPRPTSSQPRPRPGPEQGPRGRGLGAPTATVFRCRECGARQQVTAVLPAEATCVSCGSDLHTCSNCVNFDTSAPLECRKPVVERVTSKTRRNACPLFAPNTVQEFASERATGASSSPRDAFDALFKKR